MNKPILKLESKPSLQATHWLDLSIETKKDDDRHRANEEHERAVEAWRKGIERAIIGPGYEITDEELAEALRLMRRQPKTKETTDGR